jgi:hypothetical protein
VGTWSCYFPGSIVIRSTELASTPREVHRACYVSPWRLCGEQGSCPRWCLCGKYAPCECSTMAFERGLLCRPRCVWCGAPLVLYDADDVRVRGRRRREGGGHGRRRLAARRARAKRYPGECPGSRKRGGCRGKGGMAEVPGEL